MSKKNWFLLSRRNLLFVIALIAYPIIFFLPWSYDILLLEVSLLAWSAFLLSLLAPTIGILLVLTEKEPLDIHVKGEKGEEISHENN
ncbi:hypothetical protein CSV79_15710 [Sporosarcina sp. P13]|uniref:hypothetical protein n=1 Tax=Sporosarcina sp. P13 TaxID=2048263 RepID=UPI000C173830|nr:hypothetical protein [Sporosarcina sp. P13]PIC62692.1 hypothetical protein CSV79_15710 [Sporosarcina sp. P13]